MAARCFQCPFSFRSLCSSVLRPHSAGTGGCHLVRALLPEGMGFPGLPGADRPASALGSGRVEAMGLSSHAAEGRREMPAGRCCPHWTSPPHRPVWRGSARQGSEGQRAPCPLSGGRCRVPLGQAPGQASFSVNSSAGSLAGGKGRWRRTSHSSGSWQLHGRAALAGQAFPAGGFGPRRPHGEEVTHIIVPGAEASPSTSSSPRRLPRGLWAAPRLPAVSGAGMVGLCAGPGRTI